MEDLLPDQSRRNTVALVRWTRNPGENPAIRFVLLSIVGVVLCLLLMIFVHGLRSVWAVVLFTVIFASVLTSPTVSNQRRFMAGLTSKVNDTVAEVTSSRQDRLSAKEFRRMIKSGERRALLVGGVPGLTLHVERVASLETAAPQKWCAVFTAVTPESGTASFDRLLAAASAAPPD